MTVGELVFRISIQEGDYRDLGRWSHITLIDKHNVTTFIFTFHCPCRGSSTGLAYAQQLVYIVENKASLHDTSCTRQLFDIDLKAALEEKIDMGNQLV